MENGANQHKPLRNTKIIQDIEKANSSQPRRYSPNSLENLFNVNINYLDTLSMSALQLEELDKIRAIGHAQQETVTLAHLLKEKSNAMMKLKNDEKAAAAAAMAAKSAKQRSQSAYSNLTGTTANSRSSSLSSSSSTHSSNSTLNEKEHASENEATETVKTDSHAKEVKKKHERTNGAVLAPGGHRSKSYDNHSIQTASDINTDRRNCNFFQRSL
jgi:hypothetical protein